MRTPRVVLPGCPHHVLQRGNRKANVFGDDSDRLVYLRLLQTACHTHGTQLWEYALMDNHVHHIMTPERDDSLAKTVKETHGAYSLYVNTKYGLVGHAWQGRFKSNPMDWSYYVNAVRYVLQNPVRAGLVRRAEDYIWSSAQARCGLRLDSVVCDHPLVGELSDWSEWLKCEDLVANDLIRCYIRTGRPLGSHEFLLQLEKQTGLTLLQRKRGRPGKDRGDGKGSTGGNGD